MPEAIYRIIITRTIRYLSADRQDAAHPAGNFVANNGLAFLGSNKRICSTLTSFAFLRAKYCHVAVHQAKNNILILWNFVEIPNPCDNKKKLSHGQFANAARPAGNFVANNALVFFGATNGFAQL